MIGLIVLLSMDATIWVGLFWPVCA